MRIINNIKSSSDYLKDESQLVGKADVIYFCTTIKEVEKVLGDCYKTNTPITIQGALTGICGGAVPNSGTIINLTEMNDILGMSYNTDIEKYIIKVQPGLLLRDFNRFIKSKKINTAKFNFESLKTYNRFVSDKLFMFPTDPTETLASLGGMVACDASGACSYKYGSIRNYVHGITLVTPVKTIYIRRGTYKYSELPNILGVNIESLPAWKCNTTNIKDVAGLYYNQNMDLIDLIIGSEGVFGIITDVELILLEEPNIRSGIMLFLNKKNRVVDFVNMLRNDQNILFKQGIAAIEYFDDKSLKLLNDFREVNITIKKLPILKDGYYGSLYLEFHLEAELDLDELLMNISDEMHEYGINEEDQWLGIDSSDFEKLKLFRHAVPECVNILIANKKQVDSRIRKVGTDMSVPNELLSDTLLMYQNDISKQGLSSVIFGHMGDNHLHVNLIPNTYKEYLLSKDTIISWASYITVNGGSVTAEHGIGKLKKELLKLMVRKDDIIAMKNIREIFEPKGLINQGTLLD